MNSQGALCLGFQAKRGREKMQSHPSIIHQSCTDAMNIMKSSLPLCLENKYLHRAGCHIQKLNILSNEIGGEKLSTQGKTLTRDIIYASTVFSILNDSFLVEYILMDCTSFLSRVKYSA